MAGYSVGPPGGGDLSDLTRRAREAAPAMDELRRKEEQRQAVEERGTTIEERQAAQRGNIADATARLSSVLQANIGVLQAETAAIEANTAALIRQAEARAAVAAAAGRAVPTRTTAAIESVAPVAPTQAAAAVRAAEQRVEADRLAISAQVREQAAVVAAARSGAPRGTASPEAVLGAAGQVQWAANPWTAHRQAISDLHERVGTGVSGGGGAAAAEEQAAMQRTQAHSQLLGELERQQRSATQAVNEAAASYAGSANVLQRHGALTTEFIQAFARGEVTLREFESQMVSTMGKFGGWAIAGGLVYGVFDAFKHLTQGATETQSAVSQLGRFIPGLGGPASDALHGPGDRSQTNAAITTVRNISSQFNVPINEVADAMQVMARSFHNVADAGEATRAVLAAVKLDQVPQGQAEQYLIGISQSLGLGRGSDLTGVINSLNALQSSYGARVQQTLPGVARAAPAAVAGGLDTPALEAMVALGVRAGLTGNQVGTAVTRSITNFAFTRGAPTFQQYGISPTPGDYGGLIRQVFDVIDRRSQAGTLRGADLTNLARALGGPQLSRVFLPLLAQEEISPGSFGRYTGTAERPPHGYQEDLGAVLSTVSERFKSIGVSLQNFGSRLAQAGAFQPLITGFDVMTKFIHAIEVVTNPLVHLASLFNQLPGPLRDAVAAFVVLRGARALYNTSFGSNVQGFFGRLPTLGALDTQPRQAIRTTTARLRQAVLPFAEREQANASASQLQAARQAEIAGAELASYTARNAEVARSAGQESEQYLAYIEESERLQARVDAAEARLAAAAERNANAQAFTAQVQEDISRLTARDADTQAKINYIKERQLAVLGDTITAQEEGVAAARRVGGVGTTTTQAAVARGAGTGAEAGKAAAVAVASDAAVIGAVTATMARAGVGQDVGDIARQATIQSTPMYEDFAATGITPAPGQLALGSSAARTPRPVGAAPQYEQLGLDLEGATPRPSALMQNLALASNRVQQVADRTASAATGVWGRLTEGGLAGAAGRLASPGALLAATFATQVGGGIVGGGAGQWIQNVAGQGATGALIGSMIGKGPYGALIGAGVGTIAGSFQQSPSAGIHSAVGTGIGAAIGGGLGLLGGPLAELSVPAGAMIGGLLGGTVGSLFGGGASTPQDQAQLARLQAANAVMRAQHGGQSLSSSVESDLQTAFSGSGSSSSQAQQRLQATIQRLTAEQQLYGMNTPQGHAANSVISQVIVGAARQSATDPAAALQLLQTADQSRNQALQRQLQYRVSTAPAGGALAQAAYIGGQYQQQYNQTWTPAVQEAQSTLQGAQSAYDALEAQDSGHTLTAAAQRRLRLTKKWLDDSKAALGALTAASSQARQDATLNQQAAVTAGYQADIQTSGAQGQLAQAHAGGSQLGQLRAALATQQRNLGITRQAQAAGLDPTKAEQDISQTQAQIIDTRNKITQYGLTSLQSQGRLAESRIPTGDPVGLAHQQLTDLERQYEYVRQHREAFDPTQISDLLAQVTQARKAVVDAAVQYNTQMSDLTTQIAQAQSFGDAVAQASAGLAGAARNVAIASRGGTPAERRQAQLGELNAQNQAHQAAMQRITDTAATTAATEWGDPLAQARTMVGAAQQELAAARGIDERNRAIQSLASANSQLHQAVLSQIQAQGQLRQTLDTGDVVAQAHDAMTTAQAMLANAHGQAEIIAAEQAIAAAQVQMRQALASRYQAQGALAASLTNDPLRQISAQLTAAVRSLSVTQGPDARMAVQTQINQLKLQYQNQLVSTREGTIQFQLDMYQITSQQAINQLQDLLKLRNLSVQQRQEIASRIRQLQFADTQGGQFDLAPSGGNVNLPTVYDVHRLMRQGMVHPHPLVAGMSDQSQTTINVDVRNANDVPAVADAIERTTGAKLKGRMRAAGLRGI